MANWVPDGCVGQMFKTNSKHAPPPPGVDPPTLWGTEERLRELFGAGISELRLERKHLVWRYPSFDAWLDYYKEWFGPMKMAFERVGPEGEEALATDLRELVDRFDRGEAAPWSCHPSTSRSWRSAPERGRPIRPSPPPGGGGAPQRPGRDRAAVLLPLYGYPERPGLVFTKRRIDLRRHPGEISFPAGAAITPMRGLRPRRCVRRRRRSARPATVEMAGALPPVGTFVTGYKVHPFVGLIPEDPPLRPSPDEVAEILEFRLDGCARIRDAPPCSTRRADKDPDLRRGWAHDLGGDCANPRDLLERLDP